MKDHGVSLNRSCPCSQAACPIRGNCVLCVQNHLDHKRHLPECIQGLLRPMVQALADQMEFATGEARPDKAFWETYDREDLLKRSLARHAPKKNE